MELAELEQIKKLEDELARLTAPKNGFYNNFKRIVHLHKSIDKLVQGDK